MWIQAQGLPSTTVYMPALACSATHLMASSARPSRCPLQTSALRWGSEKPCLFAFNAALHLHSVLAALQVTLKPSAKLCFSPHPLHDGGEYDSLAELAPRLAGEGYGGGIRLLKVLFCLQSRLEGRTVVCGATCEHRRQCANRPVHSVKSAYVQLS